MGLFSEKSIFNRFKINLPSQIELRRLILIVFGLVFLFSTLLAESVNFTSLISAWSVLILSAYLLVYSIHNLLLFILFALLFYFNYSICMASYINVIEDMYFTTRFMNDIVSNTGINIILLFLLTIIFFIPLKLNKNELDKKSFKIPHLNNVLVITIGLVLVLTYIFFFQFEMPDVVGERGVPHALYEYAIQIFIVGFYFLGMHKFYLKILILLLLAFAVQNFLFGGRVIGIQLFLVYFLFFWGYRAKVKKLWPIVVVGLILLSIIGMNRGNADFSFKSIAQAIEHLKINSLTLDTAYSAYYTSLTFLKVQEVTSLLERSNLFLSFVKSIFLGGGVENCILPYYTNQFYLNYGGGILPLYFKFYLGWPGVIFSGILIALIVRVVNKIEEGAKAFQVVFAIFIVTMVFRWYLYTPLILFRGVIFLGVIYFFVNLTYNSFTIKRYQTKLRIRL